MYIAIEKLYIFFFSISFIYFLELPDIASMDPTTNIGQKIGEMLKNKLYKNSLELIRKQDQVNAEELSEFTFEQKCQYYLQLMQSYYFTVNRPYDYVRILFLLSVFCLIKFFFNFTVR